MDVFPKFIIEGDSIILGKVSYHKNLATKTEDVKGGGLFSFNSDQKSFTFSGESYDFGQVSIEDMKKCVSDGKVYNGKYKHLNLSEKFDFYYNTGSEIIKLN
jgi:hypothetical protein